MRLNNSLRTTLTNTRCMPREGGTRARRARAQGACRAARTREAARRCRPSPDGKKRREPLERIYSGALASSGPPPSSTPPGVAGGCCKPPTCCVKGPARPKAPPDEPGRDELDDRISSIEIELACDRRMSSIDWLLGSVSEESDSVGGAEACPC